jgi:hypothetical protein
MPATSSKVTRPVRSVSRRARDLPKPMARPPPDCIWRMKKIQTPMRSSIGNQEIRMPNSEGTLSSDGAAVMRTPLFVSRSMTGALSGA